jgi:pimeloyl-ACP methyl ester carboxylesterase
VPRTYDPGPGWPLVLLGHGGNAQMSQARAEAAAADIIRPFIGEAERRGFILAAPATARGWGTIGYSILFSLLSKLSREFHLDPDRVYAAGHSMGGHMSWRCGINFPDRWGAVGPMSGGYDFVADGQVHNLSNVPGFATYGRDEPFQINEFNRKIAAWMEQQGYPWILREKRGGHEIFRDELPALFEFFAANPRDLYRKGIYVRTAGPLRLVESEPRKEGWGEHSWRMDRPIPGDVFHWVRLFPAENPRQVQEAMIGWRAGNQIKVTASGISQLRLYLHASMVDFDKPIELFVNGDARIVRVRQDLGAMLELVREFDDRGRIFHAALDVEVGSDLPVPVPRFV